MISGNGRNESGQRLSKESAKLRDELDKLSGLIVGKNVLQSPLDFWERYDAWREAVKGLEKTIKEMGDKQKCMKD